MRIGITYDLKGASPAPAGTPDDLQEEFDSPVTIEAIAGVFRDLGHAVVMLGDGRCFLEAILADPPDFVFNFAEGQGVSRSREARVPAVLEMLGIPHSGSDPLALALTLDKDCAKRVVNSFGVAVPRGLLIETAADLAKAESFDFWPAIVKPAWEGSSKGIREKCVVTEIRELKSVLNELRRDYEQPILVEEFIEGDELTVGLVGNEEPEVIGIMRVLPTQRTEHFVYSLEVKRDYLRRVRYDCPAQLTPTDTAAVLKAACTSFKVLGCRDVARVDFRLRDGVPYFLEINPLPGLNPESSDLVILAKYIGWSYEKLIEKILQSSFVRHGLG